MSDLTPGMGYAETPDGRPPEVPLPIGPDSPWDHRGRNERGAGSTDRRLGRLPRISKPKALLTADFLTFPDTPDTSDFWRKRKPFVPRTFGNDAHGDCTRASQAIASLRMERLEVNQTPKISDDEIIRVYYEMTSRRYGGGDTGAYEVDALDDWRNPDTTFRDTHNRPITIDAYTRLNPADPRQVRGAIYWGRAKGIKVCFNLPWAWSSIVAPGVWDLPAGQPLLGDWMPGSWGGHSMWVDDFSPAGVYWEPTWSNCGRQLITWAGFAAYCDEAHLVIDSIDGWRKAAEKKALKDGLGAIREAVNAISDIKIAA